MSAPASYNRVLAALLRIAPFPITITRAAGAAPAAGDSSIGREVGSIAWVIARAADYVEAMLVELFPDTVVESVARWEKITQTSRNAGADIAVRRAKILSVIRRSGGVQLDRLSAMLYSVLGLSSAGDITWTETLRADIEAGLTLASGTISLAIPTSGSLLVYLGKPFPGVIDETGVRVNIVVSAVGTPVVLLTSPAGTSWAITLTGTNVWYENRTDFLGERASGAWTLSILDATGSKVLTSWQLLVSNSVDATQIYNFFAYRNLALSGTPNTPEAQRLLNRAALAHMNSHVIERAAFIVEDPHSLVDREPVG